MHAHVRACVILCVDILLFVTVFLWLYQYWPVGLCFFVVLYCGAPLESNGSGSGYSSVSEDGATA